MPQLQNAILKDRASTPVNHTFTPRDIKGNVGELVESQGVPVGENRLTVSLRKTANGRYKGVVKLAIPEVATQTINGVSTPVVVRTAYAEVNVDFSATSSEEERNNAIGMLHSALAPTVVLVNDTLVKLEGIY